MISNNIFYLEFDINTKNFDLDEELDKLGKITKSLSNLNPFETAINLTYNFNENDLVETTPFYQLYYNNNIIKFKNRDELTNFVIKNTYYENQYYIFNIQKKSHIITITMRHIESIINYLLNFYNNL